MKIRTVCGDIDPDQLGIALCHEHLLWTPPESDQAEDPDLGLESPVAAVDELRRFKAAGGGALVEMTTAEIGRAPQKMLGFAQSTGVHVIAAAGHHKAKFSARALEGRSVEQIAARMVHEIRQGMDDTTIRAGVIKAATSRNQAAESERKVIAAAGLAHQETGAPVSTHTEAGTFAVEQARLLLQAGVRPEMLCIGHLDRGLPLETIFELADLGVYLGFDQVGKEKHWPDAERVRLVQALVARGHVAQILLSGDTARKTAWQAHNPQAAGLAQLITHFAPRLAEVGIDALAMLRDNPRRYLAF